MNRREYDAFAKVLARNLRQGRRPAAVDAIRTVARDIADVFASERAGRNNFDRGRFYQACGLNDGVTS